MLCAPDKGDSAVKPRENDISATAEKAGTVYNSGTLILPELF